MEQEELEVSFATGRAGVSYPPEDKLRRPGPSEGEAVLEGEHSQHPPEPALGLRLQYRPAPSHRRWPLSVVHGRLHARALAPALG